MDEIKERKQKLKESLLKIQRISSFVRSQQVEDDKEDYYIDELLYCHKCNTQKQQKINVCDCEITVYCTCKCQAEKNKENHIKEQLQQKLEENKEIMRHFEAVSFPLEQIRKWTFENDDLQNPEVSRIMKKYVEEFPVFIRDGKGLLLHGDTGTGKTFMAACVSNELQKQGYRVLVTSFVKIINVIQDIGNGQKKWLDNLKGFNLLVIDDLGVERETEYVREQVYNIINTCCIYKLPMLITTNLSFAEIFNCENIDKKRIYQRILSCCCPLKVEGVNRRTKKLSENLKEAKQKLGI